jgi:hypothetical protein
VGYLPYEATVNVRPGGRADIDAHLRKEPEPLVRQWWFWTGITAVVATAGVTTIMGILVTRPAPPYDGGNTGWVAHPR